MLSISLALLMSATAPAAHDAPIAAADRGTSDGAALVVAQEDAGKEGAAKPAAGDKAKKPGAGVLKGKEVGMMERFVPFMIADDAVKPVRDNLILVQVIGCLPFGGLLAPLILYPSEGRPELASDQLVSYLVPFVATIAVSLGIGFVAWIPALVFPPCGFLGCLGCPIGIAGWWVTNNASMNAWDRAYKGHPIAALPPERKPDAALAMAY